MPVTEAVLSEDGPVSDPAILQELAGALTTLADQRDGRHLDVGGQP